MKVIVFTSLDNDHFTNLILLQSDFLKWFTQDYSGEDTEEKDFLADKMSDWGETCALAGQFVIEYRKH